jgi:hypothetical protein
MKDVRTAEKHRKKQIKKLLDSKGNNARMQRQPADWGGKIFTSYSLGKGLTSVCIIQISKN